MCWDCIGIGDGMWNGMGYIVMWYMGWDGMWTQVVWELNEL